MAYDQHANLAYATVAVAPSPAISGTSLTVANGLGALFPTAPFNCTVYPPNSNPLASNAEIVRVTAVVGDVLTIVRAQEGTSAKNITTGWQIANTATKLVFTQIQNSIIQFISAGTTKASASEVVFANGNGITFGANGNTITASVSTGGGSLTQSTQPVAASASNGSFLFSTLGFSDANGVTFGTSAGGFIFASINQGLTSQSSQIASASNGSFTFQVLQFSDANNVTFGTSAGGVIFASINQGLTSQSAQIASASNGSFTFQTLRFSDANNVTFGTSAGGVIFASVGTAGSQGIGVSAGASSQSTGVVTFSNGSGITFGLSNGVMTAAHDGLTSQSGQAFSASGGSSAFQTLSFANSNGLTFSNVGGSVVASYTVPNTAGLLSVINVSAGTTSNNLTQLVFGTGGNVTFGISASTLTASAPSGGTGGDNGILFSWQFPPMLGVASVLVQSSGQAQIDPMLLPCNISFTNIRQHGSNGVSLFSSNASSSNSFGMTRFLAIYSREVTNSAATNFSNSSNWVTHITGSNATSIIHSVSSASHSWNVAWQTDSTGGYSSLSSTTNANTANLSQFSGYQFLNFPMGAMLTKGEYIMFALVLSTGTGANSTNLLRQSFIANNLYASLSMAPGFGQASALSVLAQMYAGNFPATTIPATLELSSINRKIYLNNFLFNA